MAYKVEFIEEANQDFKNLDRSQQILIRKSILKIEKYGMQTGEPLRGKLAGCRKLKHKKAGLRVVFRETKKGLEIIQILAIGKRSDKEVYKSATKRL